MTPASLAVGIEPADPRGGAALALLREAALEARELNGVPQDAEAPWPTNAPTPPRGDYLVAVVNGEPAGMAAHQPLDAMATELRRVFVRRPFRRLGIARRLLAAIETRARARGFAVLRLETGPRQLAAMRLYETCGYVRIAAFGAYADDPTSVCYEKRLDEAAVAGLASLPTGCAGEKGP
jgi:GNAT superfamily N-acetyltransferase